MRTFGNALFLSVTLCALAVGQDAKKKTAVDFVAKERDLMSRSVVQVLGPGNKLTKANLQETPVVRYIDETRKIGDSTIWVWTHEGIPVAIQKIEANKYFKPTGWTYCFSALSDRRVKVKWPNVRQTYQSQAPIEFKPIPDAPKPINEKRWQFESRFLSRQFSASMDEGNRKEQIRVVPKPIFEYQSEDRGILTGAIYGIATGTNPAIYLLIELRKTESGLIWHYGSSRATNGKICLLHNEIEVKSEAREPQPGQFPTWTFFWMGA